MSVLYIFCSFNLSINICLQWKKPGKEGTITLCTSPVLQAGERSPGRRWLSAMEETQALVTGILRIMHPELYHTSCEAMERIRKDSRFRDSIDNWGSPFTAMSIIVNRHCEVHRDGKSRNPYFDILASVGDFDVVDFLLDSVGLVVKVQPGGVVGLCGHILSHGAGRCDGNRVCHAWYMRSSVHGCMEVDPASWMNQSIYRNFVSDPQKYLQRDWPEIRL